MLNVWLLQDIKFRQFIGVKGAILSQLDITRLVWAFLVGLFGLLGETIY